MICVNRIPDTSVENLFEYTSHEFLSRWSRELKFCQCNTTVNAPLALNNRLNETNIDCNPTPNVQRVCTETSNKRFLHCSLAKRRKRSDDRHNSHHTQRLMMQLKQVHSHCFHPIISTYKYIMFNAK